MGFDKIVKCPNLVKKKRASQSRPLRALESLTVFDVTHELTRQRLQHLA